MTRRISLITAVAGAALVLVVPAAWGKDQPVVVSPDAFERAVGNHQQSSTVITSPDAFERAVAAKLALQSTAFRQSDSVDGALAAVKQDEPGWLKALRIRGEGMDRMYGVGTALRHSDSVDGALAAVKQDEPGWLQALRIRGEGMDRMYGVGEYSSQPSVPVSDSATNSGSEIEWPQIGIGLGIGIVLVFGLVLGLKATRNPPLAH